MVPEQKSRQKDEVVSTTIMEIVIPKQNSRQKMRFWISATIIESMVPEKNIRPGEVMNKYNIMESMVPEKKHQTRWGNEYVQLP